VPGEDNRDVNKYQPITDQDGPCERCEPLPQQSFFSTPPATSDEEAFIRQSRKLRKRACPDFYDYEQTIERAKRCEIENEKRNPGVSNVTFDKEVMLTGYGYLVWENARLKHKIQVLTSLLSDIQRECWDMQVKLTQRSIDSPNPRFLQASSGSMREAVGRDSVDESVLTDIQAARSSLNPKLFFTSHVENITNDKASSNPVLLSQQQSNPLF